MITQLLTALPFAATPMEGRQAVEKTATAVMRVTDTDYKTA
jgi:hypothetical protein